MAEKKNTKIEQKLTQQIGFNLWWNEGGGSGKGQLCIVLFLGIVLIYSASIKTLRL